MYQELLGKLFYYHIWQTDYSNRYPSVCLKPIDGWSGKSRVQTDERQWQYERMSEDDIKYVFSNLGKYDTKYGVTLRIYSLDTTKWYSDTEELQEDLYIKVLAGV